MSNESNTDSSMELYLRHKKHMRDAFSGACAEFAKKFERIVKEYGNFKDDPDADVWADPNLSSILKKLDLVSASSVAIASATPEATHGENRSSRRISADEAKRRIIPAIGSDPKGKLNTEIIAATGFKAPVITNNMNKLLEGGIVEKVETRGRAHYHRLTSQGLDELKKITTQETEKTTI